MGEQLLKENIATIARLNVAPPRNRGVTKRSITYVIDMLHLRRVGFAEFITETLNFVGVVYYEGSETHHIKR